MAGECCIFIKYIKFLLLRKELYLMLVYIISKDGHPLMPTCRCGKIRRLLKYNKAKVFKYCPFTV